MSGKQVQRRAWWRAAVANGLAATVAAMAGCAGPGGPAGEEPWPPRLRPAEHRIGSAPTPAERRERALRGSGETVLRDRPFH